MKTIHITRSNLVSVYNTMMSVKDKVVTPKLAYFFFRNTEILQKEIDAIQKAQSVLQLTPEIEEYNKKQQQLITELGENNPEYKDRSQKLYNENIDMINDYRKKEAEFGAFMNEEVEIAPAQISVDELPADLLTISEFSNIVGFFKESKEELDEKLL